MEEKEWFLYVVDHHEGPFTIDEIRKLVKKGEAAASSYVWKEGYEDWVIMTDATEFGMGTPKSDGHGTPSFVLTPTPAPTPTPVAATPVSQPLEATAPEPVPIASVSAGDVKSSDSVWCLNSRKIFSGPHSIKTIVRKVNDGEVSIRDSVWREGWSSFTPIESIPEFMGSVKTTSSTNAKNLKVNKTSSNAEALGMTGGPSTRVYKWYKSTKFLLLSVVVTLVAVYQGLATGFLNPTLETLKIKQQVAALRLTPIPFEKSDELLAEVTSSIKPLIAMGLALLPESARTWMSSVEIPEGMAPQDAETLREISQSGLGNGIRVASAMLEGDEFNPSFVIMSNALDGSSFTVVLRGKEGTLLNALSYEHTVYVDINKSMARTSRFTYDTNKPLPKGEYTLIVYESPQQQNEKAALSFANLSKRQVPAGVPEGKVAFVVDSYFLGGKKDETYQQRLKEFNDRVKARLSQETQELAQLIDTIESIANESAQKFFSLSSAPANAKRLAEWQRYRQKYGKLSAQIKVKLDQVPGTNRSNEYMLPQIYRKLLQTYELTERLHQLETAYIEKGGKMDAIKEQAGQATTAFHDLRQSITRLAK